MAKIETMDDHLVVHYKILFEDGEKYAVMVAVLSPKSAREVYGSITEEYVLVTMMFPRGLTQPILSGIFIREQYLREKMQIQRRAASFLAAIIQPLALLSPVDIILEAAEEWKKKN